MRILDLENKELDPQDVDLSLGYLKPEKIIVEEHSEIHHYKVTTVYFEDNTSYSPSSENDPRIEIVNKEVGIFRYVPLEGEEDKKIKGISSEKVIDQKQETIYEDIERYIPYSEKTLALYEIPNQIDTLNNRINTTENNIEIIQGQNQNINDQISVINDDIEDAQTKNQAIKDQIFSDIEAIQQENQNINERINTTTNNIQNQTDKIINSMNAQDNRISIAENSIQEQNEKTYIIENNIQEQKDRVSSVENDIQDIQSEDLPNRVQTTEESVDDLILLFAEVLGGAEETFPDEGEEPIE